MTSRALFVASIAAALLNTQHVSARATVVLEKRGSGWNDATPVAAVGGNTGLTLGSQRTLAVERAAAIWGEALDSDVPIVVQANFEDLGCTEQGAILGQAGSYGGVSGIEAVGVDPDLWYPIALGNRLTGRDLAPDEPDILLELNSSLDSGECLTVLGGFYYGFDGQSAQNGANDNDLLEVVLHELGHGLGFASLIDIASGQSSLEGASDVFTAHIRDTETGKLWSEMSDAERRASSTNVRRIVFEGSRTQAAALQWLELGQPSLSFEPAVTGFSGFVADAAFAENAAQVPAVGRVVVVGSATACSGSVSGIRGAVLLSAPSCDPAQVAATAERGGAVGVLVPVASPVDSPARPLPASPIQVSIPVLTVSELDANAIARAAQQSAVQASLAGDSRLPLGADALGRPLLYATQPARTGSSISHFDPLGRPDLLMEPYTTLPAKHDLDLTLPALLDLGWARECGNGRIDSGETCDDGAELSDRLSDRCRTNCTRARCGDSVEDRGEACDDGLKNSDVQAGACRSDCTLARCGDGVRDDGEACDGEADCSTRCTLERAAGGAGSRSAGTSGAGTGDEPDDDVAASEEREPESQSGCSCAVGSTSKGRDGANALLCLGVVWLWTRRHRRR